MYIYLDESGDLGFDFSKPKTSKYFIITLLFVENKRNLEKVIKNIFNTFSKCENKKHNGLLHCYKEHPKTRLKLFNQLKDKDISILMIYLDKKRVYTKLQDEKQILYNYVTNIILDRTFTKKLVPTKEKIYLIASKRETNKFFNINFKSYIEQQTYNNHKLEVEVLIKTPQQDKCLQIVDFLSWGFFRKYEHFDDSYYNLFKNKIVEENGLFK
jgi:hypothetical protein